MSSSTITNPPSAPFSTNFACDSSSSSSCLSLSSSSSAACQWDTCDISSYTFAAPCHVSSAWQFYERIGSPRYVVAPMVNQSESAFRQMCRKYEAHLCYTPMFNSYSFINSATYRNEFFPTPTLKEDRPLIVQFAGDEPQMMAKAAALVSQHCDAIDINLGCPQGIARRGHYGAFLLSEPDLICEMIHAMRAASSVPITCKIRILPSVHDTLHLVRRIVEAGCSLLTVHGRTKEQLKDNVGAVNFSAIKAIVRVAHIPVFANGGVETLEDAQRILSYTGAAGVMTSEGILSNPALFSPLANSLSAIGLAREYLQFALKYSAQESQIRAHLFKILHRHLMVHQQIRNELADCTQEQFSALIERIQTADEKLQEAKEIEQKYAAIPNWYLRWQTYKGNNSESAAGVTDKSCGEIFNGNLSDSVLDGAFSLFDSDSGS